MSRLRLAGLGCLVAALAASSFWAPALLRRVEWFDVRRVEVSGTRLLAPHEVLAASGVRLGQSVWEEPEAWESALLAHPAVAEARVTRRLPHTLRIRIEEKRPVAYVQAGALRPATAAGELLPIDPARAPVDLPIVRASAKSVPVLLAETGRLGQLDPGLAALVSEVRRAEDGHLVLVLSQPAVEVVLPVGVEAARLAQLRAVLSDLERRLVTPGGPAGVRVDLRFGDQIVVRLPSTV